ncbi:MAG TPA: TonB-dependent receptor [Methylomirabilota bacterium]
MRARARRLLGVLLLAAAPAGAQETEPPARLEPVVVTATRLEQKAGDVPASVTVLTRDDVRESPSQTLDDLLRQVPGFSLFRRTSSVVGHPTTQGFSLRGIGPSGTSRALVLLDGVPLNDPFGGWVYWNRVPLLGIEQVEVVRGGGSSVWGNYALGGVVQVLGRRPTERGATLEASYGTRDTSNLSLLVTETAGPFRILLEGNRYETGGYPIVKESRRGRIDVDAESKHHVFNGRVELHAAPGATFWVSGNYYDEERLNGTPLQVNDTTSGIGALGGRLLAGDGEWRFATYANWQEFHSTFTTQAADRNSEVLALDQTVPTTSAGGWLQWSRRFDRHLVSAGGDVRWVTGETHERVFVDGIFRRTRTAGGEQVIGGVYVQDVWAPHPAVEVVGGLRGDVWLNYDAFRRDTPPPSPAIPARQAFSDIERIIPSPRLALLVHATPTTDLRASVYQGFRVPTLNELYRPFRVRNDVTVGNATLRPERLTGGEAGVTQRWGPLEARVTGFVNEVKDLVANVTLATRLPDCPVGTTCRQRQNLELARIQGVETELELRLARDWRLLAAYLFTDARVVDAPGQPALEGKRLAQVPEHHVTLGVQYRNPALVNVTASARYVGTQFEDDLNTLPLGSYVVFDLFASRAVTTWLELFAGVENLLDTTYTVARTSEGVISIGAPRIVRGGLRLTF